MPQRISKDISADVASADSPSFKSLVCIQNQQASPHSRYVHPLRPSRNASSEFEFSQAAPDIGTDVLEYGFSVEKLSANGQPQAMACRSSDSRVVQQSSSKSVKTPSQSINRKANIKGSSLDKGTKERNNKNSNGMDKKHANGGKGIGQKIFMFSCRDCRTVEPAMLTREQAKKEIL